MKQRRGQVHGHPEMTAAELARCRPAAEVDPLGLPIPTHLVSNEEYFPPFLQTPEQAQVEARVLDGLETVPGRLNLSRRDFLRTSAGLAVSFAALNEVFRRKAYGETLFRVRPEAVFDHDAFRVDGPPADLFVFDDQCHLVRGQAGIGHIGAAVRVLAEGESARFPNSPFLSNPWNPRNLPDEHGQTWANWNPALVGTSNYSDEEYWLGGFIRHYFLESQTTVALISNVTAGTLVGAGAAYAGYRTPGTARNVYEARPHEILTAAQNHASREFINHLAGSTRALSHGLMYMGAGNLWYLQEQIDQFAVDSWKGYQLPNAKRSTDDEGPFEAWRFDDEELAFPTFEFIGQAWRRHRERKPGLNTVCVHKGLGESSDPSDIPVAAVAFPDLNFVIYHSCIRPTYFNYESWADVQSGRMRDGVPDIKDTTEFAQLVAPYPNVYAELGTIFAGCTVTFPTVCAHVLGILFKYLGADRIVWGTDSTWYGGPQWQIEAFWRFRMPESFQERYGYPDITLEMKRKVLGLNSARLYGLVSTDSSGYRAVPGDYDRRIAADGALVRVMEYDDRVPNELPMEHSPTVPSVTTPYGTASVSRGDHLETLRAAHHEATGTRFGLPTSRHRTGWIRTR